jgi:hypothetical protein
MRKEFGKKLLRNKYLHTKSLAEFNVKPTDSPFWNGLMKVKEDFLVEDPLQ